MNTSSESTFTSATINADVALASSNIANISNYSLQHQLIIATPLDPLLKHLKKTYASSAGPTDVLGAISKENIDRWLSGDCDDCNDDEGSSILVEKTSRLASGQPPISAASTFQSIHQHNELQLPVSQQRLPLSTSSSLVDALIPPIKPSRRPERTMPDFCYAPTTHVDNLLRTMPHLRHLSSGSIDSSGLGMSESKNLFHNILNATTQSNSLDPSLENVDYATAILRQHSNLRASTELASFLQTLSNEMPHDKFITVESEVYSKLFSLVHSKTDRSERLAGVAALDALLAVPSFDQDKKTIRFGNNLSNGLKAATADYEFLHAVARALGKMASSAANVDRVEFEIGRSLEWLRSDRGDHRRLAAVLVLRELAREAPTAFYGKTQQSRDGETWISNEFLDNIFPVMRDRRLIVRVCAADALSECIKILMERQPTSMTAPLCNLFSDMMQGLTFDPSDRKDHTFNFQKKSYTGQDISAAINAHGSLLAVGAFLAHTGGFIMPRLDEVCRAVLNFIHHPVALLKLEVIRLIPRLARRCPGTYAMRYLGKSLTFLIKMASRPPPPKGIDMRPTAFESIGLLYSAMRDEEMPQVTVMDIGLDSSITGNENGEQCYHLVELKDESDLHSKLDNIFVLISDNLRGNCPLNPIHVRREVLGCLTNVVDALGELCSPYLTEIVEDLFDCCRLSEDLIKCLRSIATSLPSEKANIEHRLLKEITNSLTGTKSLDIISNLFSGQDGSNVRPSLKFIKESSIALDSVTTSLPTISKSFMSSMSLSSMKPVSRPKRLSEPFNADPNPQVNVVINTSEQPHAVSKLVLSLRTLRNIGASYLANELDGDSNMLLPFLQQVIAQYLSHPACSVRKEAAITCCKLLLPCKKRKINKSYASLLQFELSSESSSIMEEVLLKLLRLAISDPSPVVRLCVIRGLDERYYPYLCQLNLLSPLFLVLEDEAVAVRACTLQLLGRLARLNPSIILPVLRKLLIALIIELSCGAGNSVGRETATRLMVVFLREEALHRLAMPVVPSIIDSLPLANVAPRLVSISLEALGELATVAHSSLNPWLQQLIPHILDNMLGQNSSKQCISLTTMGKIAFGTGYVISPYLDYPHLLSQASDILPTTKRAPWELRREVFRLFGTLGAIDPDRLGSNSHRTGGRVGGGYFVDFEDDEHLAKQYTPAVLSSSPKRGANLQSFSPGMLVSRNVSSSMPDFRASLSQPNKVPTDGSVHKNADNDEPAHLFMYEQYTMASQPLTVISSKRRLVPSDSDFYPTVAISSLVSILRNQSLSTLHTMVMKAVMFIFNALGIQSVPFLKQIVPHILATIKHSDQPGIREALLQQLTSLSTIVREHLRPYLVSIFNVVEEFWFTKHLSSLCNLVERIATAVPDDVREFVPLLVRLILSSLEDIDTSEWSDTADAERLMILLKFTRQCMRHEFFHLLIPALVRLTDSLVNPEPDGKARKVHIYPLNNTSRSSLAVETIVTISLLLQSIDNSTGTSDNNIVNANSSLPSRIVQPFLRMLGGDVIPNKAVGTALVECICVCTRQLGAGKWLSFYHSQARDIIYSWQIKVIQRTSFIPHDGEMTGESTAIRSHLPSPADLYDEVVGVWVSSEEDFSRGEISLERSRASASDASLAGMVDRLRARDVPNPPFIQSITSAVTTSQWSINVEKLHKSWDVAQKTSREDYDEWMRKFSIGLLQEAPSAALRACAELAASYSPLARELFSSAFVCCWVELDEQSRANLVHSLQHVFASDASLEILQLLLNLCEFMEHDVDIKGAKGGLPIKINVLADLAIKCRAYSKALHYKEVEYIRERSGSCVEYLIDINKKLDLPEAALGVLKSAKIELERRGSPVFTHNRTNSRDTKNLAYSVLLTDSSATAKQQNSWAGNVMYETWLTKLGSWAEALSMYELKLAENPFDVNSILGCMDCYDARGDWQRALNLAEMSWPAITDQSALALDPSHTTDSRKQTDEHRQRALKLCAQASWRLGRWDLLESYTDQLVQSNDESHSLRDVTGGRATNDIDFDSYFYRSVLHVHQGEWEKAAKSIDSARRAMDSRFTALLSESYKRAYPSMVSAQTLSELEEVIQFRQFETRTSQRAHLHAANRPDEKEARNHLIDVWRSRLDGCRVDAEVHSSILAIRSLVLGPTEEVDATISLAALSRQAEAFRLAERTLLDPLEKMSCNLTNGKAFGFHAPLNLNLGLHHSNPGFRLELVVNGEMTVREPYGKAHISYYDQLVKEAGGDDRLLAQHKLYFAYTKHLWASDRKDEAIHRLGLLCNIVDLSAHCGSHKKEIDALRVRCWLKYGQFKLRSNLPGEPLSDALAADVILSYKRATESNESDYIAWHSWALINFRLAEQIHGFDKEQSANRNPESVLLHNHVIAAVKAFVLAISMGTKRWSASVQQDMLNLLSCLFKYGELHDVARTINEGLGSIKIEAWLGVLPQLLARIQIKSKAIRSVLHPLLVRLGAKHPQALMYPLSVLLKSPVVERKNAAESLINSLKAHSNDLVEEARMVSSELIRVAILWLELWHEGLEDASRLYYGEGNVAGMLDVLLPLHQQLEKGASTRREQDFLKSFGRDLSDAHNHIKEYVRLITSSGQSIPVRGGFMSEGSVSRSTLPANVEAEAALNQAWDLYYTVFRRINKQLPSMTTLELDQCSPNLNDAKNLELSVPGTYNIDGSYVKIERFITNVQVITSKQRPRKIIIRGDNGKDYVFLLKGHEDLRQDERVMQLFGLVNALLARDGRTNKQDLNIQRYAIAPLSHNCGVVGWVPNCDTLHCLIRDYREGKKIPLNAENREMMALAPNYDSLTSMQKVEIFTEALSRTTGQGNDLYEVLWIKSTNSEEWLERRTNFTRSLAVMSMVGYILGLGDRHPSNLMLDQISGRVLHIDFGDCFEVAMHREKFPERVPFRLTRMLTRAMEVSGIEGSYRSTCEKTLSVLRDNKGSLVDMLEAFVHDPLISWRLLNQSSGELLDELETAPPSTRVETSGKSEVPTLSLHNTSVSAAYTSIPEPIHEGQEGEEEDDEDGDNEIEDEENEIETKRDITEEAVDPPVPLSVGPSESAQHAKSLKMFSEMKALAANLSTSSRLQSLTGSSIDPTVRSHRSIRQRELLSFVDGAGGMNNEEVLNEKALAVIRRVQDKLSGTDFSSAGETGDPLDVPEQVQRLIVQATSSENLCQLFIGWCAFW